MFKVTAWRKMSILGQLVFRLAVVERKREREYDRKNKNESSLDMRVLIETRNEKAQGASGLLSPEALAVGRGAHGPISLGKRTGGEVWGKRGREYGNLAWVYPRIARDTHRDPFLATHRPLCKDRSITLTIRPKPRGREYMPRK